MKGFRYILILLFVVMLTPNTVVAQKVGKWHKPTTSDVENRKFKINRKMF